jgi:cbb3-type cytochrome oxidase maturation protein
MDILIFLIPIALCLGAIGLVTFLWALRTGQFDDLEGSSQRILLDEEPSN